MQHKEISLLEHSFYAELYRCHAPGLFAYAYQRTSSLEEAEDIVLDVFLTVLQNQRFPTFDEKKQEAWLWTITRNKNERSLERVWSRFVQSQEHPIFLQERQPEEPGGKQLSMAGKGMHEEGIYQETGFSTLNSRPVTRPRRSLWRTLSMSGAVAVILITILSWALLSYGLHHGGSHAGQTALEGSSGKVISSAKLLCSASYSNSTTGRWIQPPLDWSARGVIATSDPFLKTFSAQTCTSQSRVNWPHVLFSAWSPDGERLLTGAPAAVVDANTGRVIASSTDFNGMEILAPAAWASNGRQFVTMVYLSPTAKVQVWDASTGALVRTALTFDGVLINDWISPNGKYLAVQKSDHRIAFWDIDTGKLVSITSSSVVSSSSVGQGLSPSTAWSPDGTSFAIGIFPPVWPTKNPIEVQVWSIATGQLTASFKDSDTFEGAIAGLAWSPNGKYLAESSAQIHIWDVATKQLVATFGKVTTKTTSSNGKIMTFSDVASVAWAPDSSMLVSLTNTITYSPGLTPSAQNRLNVWQLS